MSTIKIATPEDWIILLDKYCTCKTKDIFPDKHKDRCGFKQLLDDWKQEYLRKRPWLEGG